MIYYWLISLFFGLCLLVAKISHSGIISKTFISPESYKRNHSPNTFEMEIIIVGGGPVACLVAIELRKRQINVRIYEKKHDPRIKVVDSIKKRSEKDEYSYTLALSMRGLQSLSPAVRNAMIDGGVYLHQRVIHQSNGSIAYQSYGTKPEECLLAIQRSLLYTTLLNEAEQVGAKFFFGHACIEVNTNGGTATFINKDDHIIREKGMTF